MKGLGLLYFFVLVCVRTSVFFCSCLCPIWRNSSFLLVPVSTERNGNAKISELSPEQKMWGNLPLGTTDQLTTV